MSKFMFTVLCAVTLVAAEPPVPHHHQHPGAHHSDSALDSSYGPPSGHQHQRPSAAYGVPGYQYEEPANYEFHYAVESPEYGVQFGHQEARDGDVAQGSYYVLLPDGRLQNVQYVADQEGYRPKITYQQQSGGYGRGPAHSSGY